MALRGTALRSSPERRSSLAVLPPMEIGFVVLQLIYRLSGKPDTLL
jgi:hypothetical protein